MGFLQQIRVRRAYRAMSRRIEDWFLTYREHGDTRALGEVFDRSAPELLSLARHLAPPASEAEDLLQATFLTAMESSHSFHADRPLMPWLAGILANHARKALRARLPASSSDRPDGSPLVDPQSRAELAELQENLRRSLGGIPQPYRPVLSLYLLHGLSPQEIAETLDRSRPTVRSQIHRGLDLLRRGLPAGLVGSLAAGAVSTRGLAAVRTEILATAGEGMLRSPSHPAILGGLLSMKKIATISALVIAGLFAFWVGWHEESAQPMPPSPRVSDAEPMTAPLEGSAARTVPRTPVAEDATSDHPEPGTGPGSLLVRVLHSEDEAPVPSRWITLIRADTPQGNTYFPLLQARTDDDGSVLFEGLEPTLYELRPLLVPGGRPRVRVEAGERAEYTFSVPSGVHVQGRVVDGEGHGVPGAAIYLDRGWTSHELPVALADGRGHFEIGNVPDHYRIGALADGFAPSHHHSVQADSHGQDVLTIVMNRPSATLRGQVVDPEGNPIPRAFVAFQPVDLGSTYRDDQGRSWRPAQIQVLRTDAAGTFVSHQVPAEPIFVVAGSTKNLDLVHAFESLELAPGSEHYMELRTRRGATIRGTVRRGGRPVADLEVHASPAGRGAPLDDPVFLASQFDIGSAFTNQLGEYRLSGLRPGTYTMYAEGLDRERSASTVELSWEETVERELFLKPNARLLLRVVDGAGSPLPDWQILVHYRSDWPSAVTDSHGEVRFEDFDEGAYTVLVLAPSDREESHHVYAALGAEDLTAGDSIHEIRVPDHQMPTSRIRARILDSEGRVPEAASLGVDALVLRLPQWGSLPVDERGYAESGLLPPGTYKISVHTRDHATVQLGEKVLHPHEVLDLGEIRVGG